MGNIFVLIVLLSFFAGKIMIADASPVFIDKDDDGSDEDVVVCTDCKEDSLGRVEGSDGSKWKQGADGHWRSDKGEDCYYSKSLDKYICD